MNRLALISCALLVACGGGSSTTDTIYDFSGLPHPDGFVGGEDGSTSDLQGDLKQGDLATSMPPVITIVSPSFASDISGNLLDLKVSVTSPILRNITSVTVVVSGDAIPHTMITNGSGVYTDTIDITNAQANSTLTITATDDALQAGQLVQPMRHDRGPVITFVEPMAATARGSVNVHVKVDDGLDPLAAADAANVVATIRTLGDVALTPVNGSNPLELAGVITFSSFAPVLAGAQIITVTAKNSKGTQSIATRQFTVDNAGPVISIQNPIAGKFVGGLVNVKATIIDAEMSGINDATVMAVFAGGANFQVALARSLTDSTQYSAVFDIHKLGTNLSFPILTVSADDTLGNHTDFSEILLIDNVAPTLSLDPPNIRVAVKNGMQQWQCSVSFDPVGAESLNDGDDPGADRQILTIKARIEDAGNFASGQLVEYVSDIDHTTVRLVAIPAPAAGSAPILAVDSDGDGICDDVNPKLVQVMTGTATSAAQYIQVGMTQVTAPGTPDYFTSGPPPAGCDVLGDPTLTKSPDPLCPTSGTQLTYGLRYLEASTPAIWTLPPVAATNSGCIGLQFDTLNRLPEGPACFAVAATDNTGNKSISAPLRTCIRRTSMANHPCDTFTPPNCTGTYDPATQATSATTCTPRTFAPNKVRYLLN